MTEPALGVCIRRWLLPEAFEQSDLLKVFASFSFYLQGKGVLLHFVLIGDSLGGC